MMSVQQKLAMRPTPIPPSARVRYEAVFVGNVLARRRYEKEKERKTKERERERKMTLSPPPIPGVRKSRQAAGWRGLSVDLITNPEHAENAGEASGKEKGGVDGDEVDGEMGLDVEEDERLDGRVVGRIWKASRLGQAKLKEIWWVISFFLCTLPSTPSINSHFRFSFTGRNATLPTRDPSTNTRS